MAERDPSSGGHSRDAGNQSRDVLHPNLQAGQVARPKKITVYKIFTNESESGRAFPLSKIKTIQTMPLADLIATDACAEPFNPQWVKPLSLLAMNVSYERCVGADWFTTDSDNSLSMRAGLATLDVLENQSLGDRATPLGIELQEKLAAALSGYEMGKEVRGKGLLLGIEYTPPRRLALRAPFEAFAQIHPAMFGRILVMRLFRNKNVLTQICGNDFMVLKVSPALVVTAAQVAEFVSPVHDVVDFAHRPGSFWSEAMGLARRAIGA